MQNKIIWHGKWSIDFEIRVFRRQKFIFVIRKLSAKNFMTTHAKKITFSSGEK